MKRSGKLSTFFLHLATLVLLLNASVGYGACCFTTLDQTAAVSTSSEQTLPPCHRTTNNQSATAATTEVAPDNNIDNNIDNTIDKTNNNTNNMGADTCCLICLAMVPSLNTVKDSANLQPILNIGSVGSLLNANITPLFRPPIS